MCRVEDCLQHSTQVRRVQPLKHQRSGNVTRSLSFISCIVHSFYFLHSTASTSNLSAQCFLRPWSLSRGLEHRRTMAAWRTEINSTAVKSGKQGTNRNSLNRSRICSREWYISNSAGKGSEAGSTICSTRGGMIVCYSVSVHTFTNPVGWQWLTSKSLRAMIDWATFWRFFDAWNSTTWLQPVRYDLLV